MIAKCHSYFAAFFAMPRQPSVPFHHCRLPGMAAAWVHGVYPLVKRQLPAQPCGRQLLILLLFYFFAAVIAVRNNTSNTVFVVPLIRAVESASLLVIIFDLHQIFENAVRRSIPINKKQHLSGTLYKNDRYCSTGTCKASHKMAVGDRKKALP